MPLNVCRYFQADHFFFNSSHLCLHIFHVQCLPVWSVIRRTTLSLPVLFNVVLVLLPARHSSTNAVMKKLVCSAGQVTRAIPNSNCSIENCDIAAAIMKTMVYGRTHIWKTSYLTGNWSTMSACCLESRRGSCATSSIWCRCCRGRRALQVGRGVWAITAAP